jgi:hypothetical protein
MPSLSLGQFAVRAVLGGLIYYAKETFIQYYDIPMVSALNRLAGVLAPVNQVWASSLRQQASQIDDGIAGKRIIAATQVIVPQFSGAHVNVILGVLMAYTTWDDVQREVLTFENQAMTLIKQYTGLNIQVNVDVDDLVHKFLGKDLDPAMDVNLAADAISYALSGNIPSAVGSAGALANHLRSEYSVTFSGSVLGRPITYKP